MTRDRAQPPAAWSKVLAALIVWVGSGACGAGNAQLQVEPATASADPDASPSEHQRPTPGAAEATAEPLYPELEGAEGEQADSASTGPALLSPADGVAQGQPWLGIEMRAETTGVKVIGVFTGSPAASAGLAPGDLLLTLAGEVISQPTDIHAVLAQLAVGDDVRVTFRRAGKERFARIVLTAKPTSLELMRDLYVGKPAPSISTLRTIQGSTVPSLAQLRGNVIVLEFWATWCTACRILSPTLNHWHERYAAQGVRVLSVSIEPPEEIRLQLPQLEIRHPVFSDPNESVTLAYRASALPTTFLIDGEGVVQNVMVGYDPDQLAEFRGQMLGLLKQPPSAAE